MRIPWHKTANASRFDRFGSYQLKLTEGSIGRKVLLAGLNLVN